MTMAECDACHRTYAFLAYRVGERLRCVCGKVLHAKEARPQEAPERPGEAWVSEQAETKAPVEVEAVCPRCQVNLRRREVADLTIDECPGCCGMFLKPPEVTEMLKPQEGIADSKAAMGLNQPKPFKLEVDEVRYSSAPSAATG
jgi:Zn-finger nucleic acid-binding protein